MDLFGVPMVPDKIMRGLPKDWDQLKYEYFWGGNAERYENRYGLNFNDSLEDRKRLEVWNEGTWKPLFGPPCIGKIYRMRWMKENVS